jgi:hypothetical protein
MFSLVSWVSYIPTCDSIVNVKPIRIYFGMQIDAVAKSREAKFRMVSNDEREQTLNQLLTVSIPLTLLISFKCKKY